MKRTINFQLINCNNCSKDDIKLIRCFRCEYICCLICYNNNKLNNDGFYICDCCNFKYL